MSHKPIVIKQIIFGFLFVVALSAVLWIVFPEPKNLDRVTYTLSWAALYSLPLIVGIHSTLFTRFNSHDYIKGYAAENQPGFNAAYLSNTVEQTLLNVLAAFSLGMVAPQSFIKLVPIQACIFLVGRMLYFASYKKNPMQRFIGFVMGYYAALLSISATLYWAVKGV